MLPWHVWVTEHHYLIAFMSVAVPLYDFADPAWLLDTGVVLQNCVVHRLAPGCAVQVVLLQSTA
jgi:hypothetical protein